jgi:hypothetical protein
MPKPAEKLTPTDPRDRAEALDFALRFHGRKRVHNADEIIAEIVLRSALWPFGARRVRGHETTVTRRGAALGRGFEGSVRGRWRNQNGRSGVDGVTLPSTGRRYNVRTAAISRLT